MTPEYQKWTREKILKNKRWVYDNVIRLDRYSDMKSIISAVEKALSIEIPDTDTIPNIHELYKWLDTHEKRSQ